MAKGYDLKAGQGFQQPFVIAGQASQAGDRGETALAPPETRQQDKVLLGLGSLDDVQLYVMFGCTPSRLCTG